MLSSARYPGAKKQRGELPSSTCRRLLEGPLGFLQGKLATDDFEYETERYPSDKFGLDTTYFRALQTARLYTSDLTGDIGLPVLGLVPNSSQLLNALPPAVRSRAADYFEKDVFIHMGVMPNDDCAIQIFAWMTPKEFEFLAYTSPGSQVAKAWVGALDVHFSV